MFNCRKVSKQLDREPFSSPVFDFNTQKQKRLKQSGRKCFCVKFAWCVQINENLVLWKLQGYMSKWNYIVFSTCQNPNLVLSPDPSHEEKWSTDSVKRPTIHSVPLSSGHSGSILSVAQHIFCASFSLLTSTAVHAYDSHEEKRSGEPSRTSWASEHFCDNVN